MPILEMEIDTPDSREQLPPVVQGLLKRTAQAVQLVDMANSKVHEVLWECMYLDEHPYSRAS